MAQSDHEIWMLPPEDYEPGKPPPRCIGFDVFWSKVVDHNSWLATEQADNAQIIMTPMFLQVVCRVAFEAGKAWANSDAWPNGPYLHGDPDRVGEPLDGQTILRAPSLRKV